eukprot:Transcript_14709.p2 GENE.Transcript_14709~~Transcript_14709.p2  ORF type:complete len:379 (-),score=120.42 Transcript_14709:30-1166(-)
MAAAEPAWSLVLCKGQPRADRPATIELRAGTTTIGREEGDVDVRLDSTSFPKLISRLHCRLAANADHVVLQDCSVNGCSVDGATVRRAALSEGSTIVFGPRGSTTEFAYRLQKHEGGSADGAARKRARTEEEPSSVPAKPEEPGKRKEPPAKPVEPAEEAAGPEEAGLGAEELNGVMVEELQCCVCRELLCRPHALPCSHTFCGGCIFQWARREQSCPICREPLAPTPPLLVRPLDALSHRLACKALAEDERSDWEARRADWDAQAEAARAKWGELPEKKPAVQLVPEQMIELAAEHAPSGRSTCRRCLRRIAQGALRCGVVTRVPMFGHTFIAWHHARCVRNLLAGTSLVPAGAEVRGLAALPPADQRQVREAFGLS